MPFDTRRINGPSSTQSLATFGKRSEKPLLDTNKLRTDGRKSEEIRPMYLQTGIVQQANGSAYLETRGTKLICAVYGPRDNPKKHDFSSTGNLTCEICYAPFARQERQVDHGEKQSKEQSAVVVEALHSAVCLESYPKAQIDVYINVLEDNGNTLSHAIVAASVALADAGIEMLDLVTSCSTVYNDAMMLCDPNNSEITHGNTTGSLTIAYLPSLNEISCLLKDGAQDLEQSSQSINTCIESCLRIHTAMKDCLISSAKEKNK